MMSRADDCGTKSASNFSHHCHRVAVCSGGPGIRVPAGSLLASRHPSTHPPRKLAEGPLRSALVSSSLLSSVIAGRYLSSSTTITATVHCTLLRACIQGAIISFVPNLAHIRQLYSLCPLSLGNCPEVEQQRCLHI